jgi:hypothetical protein
MKTKPLILALLAGLAASGGAQAALHDRGGGLIYDDVLNVTWLQDANLAATNTFGLAYSTNLGDHPNDVYGPTYTEMISTDGGMNWGAALHWIDAMNAANYLGYHDWRLPTMVDTGTPGCNYAYSGTDCGHNALTYDAGSGTVYSELAYMYYVNLGLTGYYNPDGSDNPNFGIFGNGTLGGQNDVGLVKNLQSYVYWSGMEYAPITNDAWLFNSGDGFQGYNLKYSVIYAWAVRPGDVAAPIPEPETYALLLAGLGLVGWAARRRRG